MVFTLVCSNFTNDLLKSSANVENLANLAGKEFNVINLVLVHANLLRHEDSKGTRSIYFVYLY